MSVVSRGFTDHEELDSLGLVNMNGRIYDSGIGRFMSADPFVQAPEVTQNFNRYSYVLNNPLSFTDPSGFSIFNNFFKWLTKALGPLGARIVTAIIGIAVGILTYGIANALGAAWYVAAFASGFTGAFTSTLLSGANIGQALQSAAISGAIAVATAGVLKYALPGPEQATEASTTVSNTGSAISQSNPSGIQIGVVDAEKVASEPNLSINQPFGLQEATAESVVVHAEELRTPLYRIIPQSVVGPFGASIGASVAAPAIPRSGERVPSSITRRIELDRSSAPYDPQTQTNFVKEHVFFDVKDQYGDPIRSGLQVNEDPQFEADSVGFKYWQKQPGVTYTQENGHFEDDVSIGFGKDFAYGRGYVWIRQTFVIQNYTATFYMRLNSGGGIRYAGLGGEYSPISVPFFPGP